MTHADAARHAERMRGFLSDVESLAKAASGGRWPRLGQIEGTDPSGTVSFIVDDRGTFVTIHLAPQWRQTVGVSGLPAGLKAAQRNARDKVTVARLTFRRLVGPPSESTPPPGHDDFQHRHGLSHTTDYSGLISSWRTMTEASYQRFEDYERLRGADSHTGRTVVNGPAGLVRLTLDNGLITDVALAEWRLAAQTTEHLAADLCAALQTHAGVRHG